MNPLQDLTHPEFVEGYCDGRDKDCPEPNENRSERYKHSFAIGRAEIEGRNAGSYQQLTARADLADHKENTR